MTATPSGPGVGLMRVVVVGAGQMGSIYGAAAFRNSHEVTFVDSAPEVVDAINARGLRIDRQGGPTDELRIPATTDPSQIGGPVDVVLVLVKGWATSEAADSVRPIVGPATALVTLQNGLGNEEVLRPPTRIMRSSSACRSTRS